MRLEDYNWRSIVDLKLQWKKGLAELVASKSLEGFVCKNVEAVERFLHLILMFSCNFLWLCCYLYYFTHTTFFFFFLQDRILLWPNLSIYVCETLSWRLKLRPLPPTLHKHLYLCSDHYTKGVRWSYILIYIYIYICVCKLVNHVYN